MNKFLLTMLMSVFILPSFVSWLPHDFVHSLNQYHQASHGNAVNAADHHHEDGHAHGHKHKAHSQIADNHHPNGQLDTASYFKEYLHVDLGQQFYVVTAKQEQKVEKISYPDFALNLHPLYEQHASVGDPFLYQERRKPTMATPLYLSTLRIRV